MASSISIQFNERDPAYSSLACNTKTCQNIKLDFVFWVMNSSWTLRISVPKVLIHSTPSPQHCNNFLVLGLYSPFLSSALHFGWCSPSELEGHDSMI